MRLSKVYVAICAAIVMGSMALSAQALVLTSPTQDQVVREKVRISMPIKSLPSDMITAKGQKPAEKDRPFVSIQVQDESDKYFVGAMSADQGIVKGGEIIFFWDSKARFRDRRDSKTEKTYKDGPYVLWVNIYDSKSKNVDSASVKIQLRNRVARTNPAPGLLLANRLEFGKSNTYGVHSDVQVFETVSGMGIPILGGLGMSSDFKVVQTVDDIRDDGTFLLRYRIAKGARMTSFGQERKLYDQEEFGPQLYRLVTKLGKVVKRNVFTRQAQYTITDVLPTLPKTPVKEGDSWPCTMNLKIEGITDPIAFSGTSMLESLEWQNGHECAKIVSRMAGDGTIMISGGKIRSESSKVGAEMVTYFAYKSGRMLRNEVTLNFNALIFPGAGDPGDQSPEGATPPQMMPSDMGEDEVFNRGSAPPGGQPRGKDKNRLPEGAKKGSVQINLVMRLES